MLYVCFSFDYELFLGKNYLSFEEVLFKPSEKISDVFLENDATCTFFADILSCSTIGDYKDYKSSFYEQMSAFVKKGLDVQLHLHTNWLSSKIENGQVKISSSNYKIHDLKDECQTVIKTSIDNINSVCRGSDPSYDCIAYRAGGFLIQPEKEISALLFENGIRIDSSVAPFLKSGDIKKNPYAYDFFEYPKKKINCFLVSKKDYSGGHFPKDDLFEVPILTFKPRIKHLLMGKKKISLPPVQKRGEYVSFQKSPNDRIKNESRIYSLFFKRRVGSLDSYTSDLLFGEIKYFYRKHKCKKNDAFISLIGHPKLLFTDERIANIDNLIKLIKKSDMDIKIVNYRDIYDLIRKGERTN